MALKLRVKPRFPATVSGSGGISIAVANSVYTVKLDLSTLAEIGTVLDSTNSLIAIQNTLTGISNSMSFSDLVTNVTISLSASLNAIRLLTPAADKVPYYTGATTAALASFTASARTLTALTVAQGDIVFGSAAATFSTLAKSASASQFLSNKGTSNSPSWAQPAFTDISGVATAAQIPLPTISVIGGVQANAGTTHQFVTGISTVTGALTYAQPAFSDISGTASNSQLANMAAWTFKANATSGSATPTDVTIDGLTLKASPASSDELILWDVAGSAIKKVTVSAVASAGSVGSYNTRTGSVVSVATDYTGQSNGRLAKSGSNLVLSPYNGAAIWINSAIQTIPDAGVTLAGPTNTVTMTIATPAVVTFNSHGLTAGQPIVFNTTGALPTGVTAGTTYYVIAAGLAANTFEFSATQGGAAVNTSGTQSGTHTLTGPVHFIYAFMNSGTMTLEASLTGHATQAGTGVEIKSGDATRTLVGIARAVNNAWTDSITQRFVRTWINRAGVGMESDFTATRTTSSASYVEINAEIRCEFLVWSDEIADFTFSGTGASPDTSNFVVTAIGWDGTADTNRGVALLTANASPIAVSQKKSGLSEGYHFTTIMGLTQTTGASTWYGHSSNRNSFLAGQIARAG